MVNGPVNGPGGSLMFLETFLVVVKRLRRALRSAEMQREMAIMNQVSIGGSKRKVTNSQIL